MKYFTPELLTGFGSADDRTADAANEQWERVHKDYVKHLRTIRPQLPASARSLLKRFCLHDARVLAIGRPKDPKRLSILLRLAAPREQGVRLDYKLADRPAATLHPSLSEPGTPLEWLYDEFDVLRDEPFSVCTHSILFTGGRELHLTLHDLKWIHYPRLLSRASGSQAPETEGEFQSLLA